MLRCVPGDVGRIGEDGAMFSIPMMPSSLTLLCALPAALRDSAQLPPALRCGVLRCAVLSCATDGFCSLTSTLPRFTPALLPCMFVIGLLHGNLSASNTSFQDKHKIDGHTPRRAPSFRFRFVRLCQQVLSVVRSVGRSGHLVWASCAPFPVSTLCRTKTISPQPTCPKNGRSARIETVSNSSTICA